MTARKDTKTLQRGTDAHATGPNGGELYTVRLPWRLHGGTAMRIVSGVPWSHTCVAEESEGTHYRAAVPVDHVHVLAALPAAEFRQWAAIVQFFTTDTLAGQRPGGSVGRTEQWTSGPRTRHTAQAAKKMRREDIRESNGVTLGIPML